MDSLPKGLLLQAARLNEMPVLTWAGIARLRQDVFVVEQECAYPDLDQKDGASDTVHLWAQTPDDEIVATLRILHEHDGDARRIGRVATARDWRGRRIMEALMLHAIERCGGYNIELGAQSHLQQWYEHFGFVRTGDEFLEDGILHVPMCREGDGDPAPDPS